MKFADEIKSVRISNRTDIVRAAEALNDFAASRADMRVAPSHNIADKRTPVDAEGNFLAEKVFGWDAHKGAWWKNTRVSLNSPITTACRYESEVFWVNGEGFRTLHKNHHLDVIDLTNFQNRAMLHAAIVVPVHLPFGQIGVVKFSPVDPKKIDLQEIFETYGDSFASLADTFIRSYAHVIGDSSGLPDGSVLSKREIECLHWVAIGKTDHEISEIMARSRATIHFHIHNASIKLEAVSRSQAVFKAAQLGYITT